MKIRYGFVLNSSSSSFILSIRNVNSIKKFAEKYQKNFNIILKKINYQDKKDILQYLISEEEKRKIIKEQFDENKKALKKQIKILKNIENYLEKFDINEINLLYYNDIKPLFFNVFLFKSYYPFSAKIYYLAQRLEKINKKIYKEIFDWEFYIRYNKNIKNIKNIKRIKYNDIIWNNFYNFYNLDWFLYFIEHYYGLNIYEKKKIKNIINQIKNKIIFFYKKIIKKLKIKN